MKSVRVVALLVACLLVSAAVQAETKCWGWRGDGTGRFPDADPPLKWGRISKTVKGLRNSAEKLSEAERDKAKTVDHGTIREWLVLGPIAVEGEWKGRSDREQIKGEALFQPKAGDKVGGRTWQRIETNGSLLYFNQHLETKKGQVVYACTYLYSPQARRVLLCLGLMGGKLWVNGETHYVSDKYDRPGYFRTAQLKKGWNTILAKTFCIKKDANYSSGKAGTAYLKLALYGTEKGETFETDGILWRAHPPQAGAGAAIKAPFSCYQPVVVGDRLFVASDPGFLICYDKNTGKQLWMRDTTAYDFVTAEERNGNAELFAKIDADQKKFREIAYAFKASLQERGELNRLNHEIRSSLKKVNKAKYHYDYRQEPGNAAQPLTDGRFVYVWYYNNIAACFDLDGKRIWKAYEHDEGPHGRHGYYRAPMLIGDDFAVEVKKNIIGFDRKTGKVNWRIPYKFNTYNRYSQNDREKSDETDITSFRDLGLYKPGVGFVAWSTTTRDGDSLYGAGNHRNKLIRNQMTGGGNARFEIKKVLSRGTNVGKKLTPGTNWAVAIGSASFLIHEGLLYAMGYGGVLRVYEADTLKRVYERQLDFVPVTFGYPYPYGAGVCASPALGGKYIYLWGSTGTTIVIEPGRTFKQVAKNRIESAIEGDLFKRHDHFRANHYYPECTVSSPIFDGNRIYYRAEEYVYCIGEK